MFRYCLSKNPVFWSILSWWLVFHNKCWAASLSSSCPSPLSMTLKRPQPWKTKWCSTPSPRWSIAPSWGSASTSWFPPTSTWTGLCWGAAWPVTTSVRQVAPCADTACPGATLPTPTRTPWLKPRPVSRSCTWRPKPWRRLLGTTSRGQYAPPSPTCCLRELDPLKLLTSRSSPAHLWDNVSPARRTVARPRGQRSRTVLQPSVTTGKASRPSNPEWFSQRDPTKLPSNLHSWRTLACRMEWAPQPDSRPPPGAPPRRRSSREKRQKVTIQVAMACDSRKVPSDSLKDHTDKLVESVFSSARFQFHELNASKLHTSSQSLGAHWI